MCITWSPVRDPNQPLESLEPEVLPHPLRPAAWRPLLRQALRLPAGALCLVNTRRLFTASPQPVFLPPLPRVSHHPPPCVGTLHPAPFLWGWGKAAGGKFVQHMFMGGFGDWGDRTRSLEVLPQCRVRGVGWRWVPKWVLRPAEKSGGGKGRAGVEPGSRPGPGLRVRGPSGPCGVGSSPLTQVLALLPPPAVPAPPSLPVSFPDWLEASESLEGFADAALSIPLFTVPPSARCPPDPTSIPHPLGSFHHPLNSLIPSITFVGPRALCWAARGTRTPAAELPPLSLQERLTQPGLSGKASRRR